MTERLAVCYHEAGHAVVADALGADVDELALQPSAAWDGVCYWYLPEGGLWRANQAAIILAGPYSESVYRGRLVRPDGKDQDDLAALMSASGLPPGSATTTKAIIAARWPLVIRLARALDQAGRLNRATIASLLGGGVAPASADPAHPPQPKGSLGRWAYLFEEAA